MVKRIFKSKKFIVASILVILILGGLIGASVIQKDDKKVDSPTVSTIDKKTENSNDSKIPDKVEQFTAPEAKTPDVCSKVSDAVKQVVGDGSRASGNSASTNNNSKVVECNYSKETQLVNIKVYEYTNEATAKADLLKVQPKGYAGQNKGKYNVVVSVVTAATNTSGGNTAAATQIAQLASEKL